MYKRQVYDRICVSEETYGEDYYEQAIRELRKIIYMYLRVVTIKCPNQTAKKALKLLSNQVATEQMSVGLIKETVVDISETNFLNVKYWISKSHFEKGRKNWQKVSQEYNEMGAIVSGVGGEGEINLSEDFKNYI